MPNAMQWLSRLGHPHLNKLKGFGSKLRECFTFQL